MVASKTKRNSHQTIFHVSKFGSELAWFQALSDHFSKQGYDQFFLSGISRSKSPFFMKAGEKYSDLECEEKYGSGPSNNLSKIIQIVSQCIRNRHSIFLSQGHLESLFCLTLKKLFRLKYGIIHHVQPKFFSLLKVDHPVKGRIHEWIYMCYIKNADFVQSLSEKVLDELRKAKVEEMKIFHSGPGIDFDWVSQQFDRATSRDKGKASQYRLIMIGRLSWEKNYLYGLEVIDELVRMDKRIHVSIYGSGPLHYEIEEKIKNLELQNHVALCGYSRDVLSELSRAGALLHFSKTESYGQVFIEATLMQVPIYSTNVGIISELSNQGNCDITILHQKSALLDAQSIYTGISGPNDISNRKFSPEHFQNHEITYVFRELSKFIGKLE